jgi:hypothetical protein
VTAPTPLVALLDQIDALHGRLIRDDRAAEWLRLTQEHDALPQLTAALRAVLALHKPWGIYTECDHDHQEEDEPGVVEIDMVGLTCREGLMYEVCVECCIEDGPFEQFQFEHCADHHEHETGKPICKTVAAITAALDVR